MTPDTALANLAVDALYFGLDKLHAVVHSLVANNAGTLALERSRAVERQRAQVGALGYEGVVSVEDVRSTKVPLDLRVPALQLPRQFTDRQFSKGRVRSTRSHLPLAVLHKNVQIVISVSPSQLDGGPRTCNLTATFPFLTVFEPPTTILPTPYNVCISDSRWRDLSFVINGVNGTLLDICDSLYSLSPLPLSPFDSALRPQVVDNERDGMMFTDEPDLGRFVTLFANEIYTTL